MGQQVRTPHADAAPIRVVRLSGLSRRDSDVDRGSGRRKCAGMSEVIWNLGTPEFIYEFMKHMNSYMKKSYEFIGYMNSRKP